MREMKDSGIEWIADIPEHWSVSKIGGLYSLRVTKVSDRDYPPLSVTNKGILPQLETAAKTNAHDDRKLVCKGDFAINSRSDRRGSCGISSYTGSVSLINTILRPMTEMHPQYYNWLFHTIQFGDEFYKWGHGIVDDLWTTGWQDMKKISIPTPPITEQAVISDFLDEQCAEIDSLISDIQSQIEALEEYKRSVITEAVTKGLDPDVEMRDSGVQWIVEIPTHWTLIRIGSLYGLRTQKVSDIDYPPLSVTKMGVLPQLDTVAKTNAHDDRKLVVKGDFVINSRSDRRGSCGISDYTGSVSLINTVLFPITEMNPRYYNWYFHTVGFADEFYRWGHGIVDDLWTTGWQDMKNILISVPPLDEQQRIADYLDSKCAEIDNIITEKKQQIETIEEYKKSLIFEYVTGKKEVVCLLYTSDAADE